MDLFPPDTKDCAWKAWRDKREKTSTRLVCLVIYGFFRMCETIDWLFPVKVVHLDKEHKGETIELSNSQRTHQS